MNANDIEGVVFKNGAATLLARVVGADETAVQQADISAAEYTAYLLDQSDPDVATAVEGHEAVDLVVADVIYDALQTAAPWDVDSTGYNFACTLDVGEHQVFTIAGRRYRIVVTLTPASGQPILVRFQLWAI
jgi:hypothetical protein